MFAHPKMLAGQYFHTVFSIDWLELISKVNVHRFNKLLLISRFVDNNIDKRTLSGSLSDLSAVCKVLHCNLIG